MTCCARCMWVLVGCVILQSSQSAAITFDSADLTLFQPVPSQSSEAAFVQQDSENFESIEQDSDRTMSEEEKPSVAKPPPATKPVGRKPPAKTSKVPVLKKPLMKSEAKPAKTLATHAKTVSKPAKREVKRAKTAAKQVAPPAGTADTKSQPADVTPEPETGVLFHQNITTALTVWNAVVLFIMMSVVIKVIKAPSETASAEDASEDMSISKALPSVAVWCSLGVILVCFNKFMYMSVEQGGFGFPCPMALTWWHMFTGMMATNVIRYTRPELMPAVHEGRLTNHGLLTAVLPIGIVFGAYLVIGNYAYMFLSVSFIQMLKSAGPMAVFSISVAFGLEKITTASMISIAIVVLGVMGASVGEMSFSWFGFVLQLAAFLLDGLRMVLLKKLMSSRGTQLDPLSGLYYYSPICCASLLLPVIYFEGRLVLTTLSAAPLALYGIIVLNGLIAFALNCSLLSLFKNASATTVSMASVVRDIFLAFGSAAVFHTTITRVQVLGYLSACLGVKLWDEIKARPGAFYKAFGVDQSEQLPLARAD